MRTSINLSDFAKVKAVNLGKTKDFISINSHNLNRNWRVANQIKSLSSIQQQRSVSSKSSFQHQDFHRDAEKNMSFGLSTLMDISISSIKKHTKEHLQGTGSKEWEIKDEIRQMREKLQKVLQKQVITRQYRSRNLQVNECVDEREKEYILQLKRQIRREKGKKIECAILKFVGRRFLRQLSIFDDLTKFRNRKGRRELKMLFYEWKQFVEREGEKRKMMLFVKEKILQKRKNKQLLINLNEQSLQSA